MRVAAGPATMRAYIITGPKFSGLLRCNITYFGCGRKERGEKTSSFVKKGEILKLCAITNIFPIQRLLSL